MKVLLCLPPDYDRNYPPLGTPALVGFLKSKGVNAMQVDLNLAYRVFLTGKIKGRARRPRQTEKASITWEKYTSGAMVIK